MASEQTQEVSGTTPEQKSPEQKAPEPKTQAPKAQSPKVPANAAGHRQIWMAVGIWTLRVVLGAVFVYSGFVKAIDPWGGLFKMEEYTAAMGLDLPRAIVLIGASLLSVFEFCLGVMTLTGSFRRLTPVLVCSFMAVMLPLTVWIYFADPVSDCGCFGDALVLSNGATLLKNIVLTAMAAGLLLVNRRQPPLFYPSLQIWVVVWSGLYTGSLVMAGFNSQPLIDFRPYKVGTSLEAPEMPQPRFVYAKDGVSRSFSADSLPEDDEWEFVERVEPKAVEKPGTLAVFDSDGEDATAELYEKAAGNLLILNVPEPVRHSISRSIQANMLFDYMLEHDGEMVALVATTHPDEWAEAVRARYPVYTAEDTDLKELARGEASLIYVSGDTIRWKTALTAVSPEALSALPDDDRRPLDRVLGVENPKGELYLLTAIYLTLMALTLALSLFYDKAVLHRKAQSRKDKTPNGKE